MQIQKRTGFTDKKNYTRYHGMYIARFYCLKEHHVLWDGKKIHAIPEVRKTTVHDHYNFISVIYTVLCQVISMISYIYKRWIPCMCHLQDLKTSAFSSEVSVSNQTDVCLANSTLDKAVDFTSKFVWIRYWCDLLGNYSPILLGQTWRKVTICIRYNVYHTTVVHNLQTTWNQLLWKNEQWVQLLVWTQVYSTDFGY